MPGPQQHRHGGCRPSHLLPTSLPGRQHVDNEEVAGTASLQAAAVAGRQVRSSHAALHRQCGPNGREPRRLGKCQTAVTWRWDKVLQPAALHATC